MGKTNLGKIQELCKKNHKYGMYTSWEPPDFQEDFSQIFHSAPWLDILSTAKLLEGHAHLLFDEEEEARKMYSQTKGNSVYACLCNPNGEIIEENT